MDLSLPSHGENIKLDFSSKHNIHVKWFWPISEFQSIRETWHSSQTRELDLQRELLFDTHADQLKRILVTLKIIKNVDMEQAAPVKLYNPMILWGSLKPSMGNASPPTPWLCMCGIIALCNARENTTCVTSASIISKDTGDCIRLNQTDSLSFIFSSTPKFYGHCEHFPNHTCPPPFPVPKSQNNRISKRCNLNRAWR